jgi:hypothetical protein
MKAPSELDAMSDIFWVAQNTRGTLHDAPLASSESRTNSADGKPKAAVVRHQSGQRNFAFYR